MSRPLGWQEVSVREVSLPVETTKPSERPDEEFLYIDISSINRQTLSIESPQRLLGRDAPSRARQLVRTGDILFSTVRPNLRTLAVVPDELDGQVASTGFCVIRPASQLAAGFLFFALLDDRLQRRVIEKARGVSYPAVRDPDILDERVLLPPLAEQERIVEAIERAFVQLDESEAELKAALALSRVLDRRLLDSAVSGALTTSSPDTWSSYRLGDVITRMTSGSRDWKPYYGRGTGVFLLAQNVRDRRLDLSATTKVDPPINDPARTRSAVAKGDVLVTIVGAGTGTVAQVADDLPEHYVSQSVALLRPKPPLTGAFLELFLAAPGYGQAMFEKLMYGQGRPHLGFAEMKRIEIPVPPVQEQREIVEKVTLMRKEMGEARTVVAQALGEISTLRRAVLQRAFTGQLVPQDSADEPASVLLDRIKAEREEHETERKNGGRANGARAKNARTRRAVR